MKIVILGGTGLIGTKLVNLLRSHGHEVIPASPSLGINSITGEGLAEGLTGAQVVVDVTNAPSCRLTKFQLWYPELRSFVWPRSAHSLLAPAALLRGSAAAGSRSGAQSRWLPRQSSGDFSGPLFLKVKTLSALRFGLC